VKLVAANGHAGSIVLRVSREQLAEAICSLQYFGFGHVETQSVETVFAPDKINTVAGGS
jgi:type III secretory pathway lipoprotein EscJ